MKPENVGTAVSTSGVAVAAEFGISLADSAHIMTILRDTLYSDKIMAVIREYSSNAWDAHRMIGKHDLPIEIHVPTYDDLSFRIRDYGPGLSRDDVFQVYTQYGASTKRGTNEAVGMLGIGCKSGFAYSDTFTVTSWHGGKKSVYSAIIDESNKGLMNLLHEEDCGEETGVQIEIPCIQNDISAFSQKAAAFFRHFSPKPKINISINEMKSVSGKMPSGEILSRDNSNTIVAVMGCVPYRADLSHVEDFEEGIEQDFSGICCELKFDIGEVDINASREELKYTNKTKRALLDKLNSLISEYILNVTKILSDNTKSSWTKRIVCQEISKFKSFVPKNSEKYVERSVSNIEKFLPSVKDKKLEVKKDDDGNSISVEVETTRLVAALKTNNAKTRVYSIPVDSRTRIVVKDENKPLKGYSLSNNDILFLREDPSIKFELLYDMADKFVEDAEIDGIEIVKLSDIPWVQMNTRSKNEKHAQRVFLYSPKLRRSLRGGSKDSDDWDVVSIVPNDEDVYVEITKFKSIDGELERHYVEDKEVLEKFDYVMPPIYGYKQKKGKAEHAKGIKYSEWRTKVFLEIIETRSEFDKAFEYHGAKVCFHNYDCVLKTSDKILDVTEKILGADHELYKILVDRNNALFTFEKHQGISSLINFARNALGIEELNKKLSLKRRFDELCKKCELLPDYDFGRFFTSSYYYESEDIKKTESILRYVKLVFDNDERKNKNAELHDDEQRDHCDGGREASLCEEGTDELQASA